MKNNQFCTYHLSTEGYSFKYREDRYDRHITHVEMFNDGNVVHKIISSSIRHKVEMSHGQVINALEAAISLNELDPTGLKQVV